jgi:hypothetical protein
MLMKKFLLNVAAALLGAGAIGCCTVEAPPPESPGLDDGVIERLK